MLPYVALTVAAVAALLVAEYRAWRRGIWIAKPLASSAFIGAALAAGVLETSYGMLILAGLIMSWLGDVLLIPRKRPRIFVAGVVSFLLGHIAFSVAFVSRGLDLAWTACAAVVAPATLALVANWLRPHLTDGMRGPAYAYMFVIAAMVVTALGTFGAAGNGAIVAGALAFYVSDLSVARDRFVKHEFVNRLWGLPLYYGAQLALAYSAATA